MKNKTAAPKAAEVVWKQVQKTMTLTGETVLELSIAWPEWPEKRLERVNRYYRRLKKAWESQWLREAYWCACADLAQKRERSRPFVPWKAQLTGQVTHSDERFLSLALCARETHGDGRVLEYRWGDTWRQEDGCPVQLKELFPGNRRWRTQLLQQAEGVAQRVQEQGVCMEGDWKNGLRRWFSADRFALDGEGILLYYPQCTLAPAVEGAVELCVPLPKA